MATLVIPKNYEDGDLFFESDLDDIRDNTLTFFNSTQINEDNLKRNGINKDRIEATNIQSQAFSSNAASVTISPSNRTTQLDIVSESSFVTAVGNTAVPGVIEISRDSNSIAKFRFGFSSTGTTFSDLTLPGGAIDFIDATPGASNTQYDVSSTDTLVTNAKLSVREIA